VFFAVSLVAPVGLKSTTRIHKSDGSSSARINF
jgi:hypothetical protein